LKVAKTDALREMVGPCLIESYAASASSAYKNNRVIETSRVPIFQVADSMIYLNIFISVAKQKIGTLVRINT
jgi:hypothetical protein